MVSGKMTPPLAMWSKLSNHHVYYTHSHREFHGWFESGWILGFESFNLFLLNISGQKKKNPPLSSARQETEIMQLWVLLAYILGPQRNQQKDWMVKLWVNPTSGFSTHIPHAYQILPKMLFLTLSLGTITFFWTPRVWHPGFHQLLSCGLMAFSVAPRN